MQFLFESAFFIDALGADVLDLVQIVRFTVTKNFRLLFHVVIN